MEHNNAYFDAQAQALWKKLNINPEAQSGARWNALDPIYSHPTTGATIYVGNAEAAKSRALLDQKGITRIVNCTASDQPSRTYGSIPNHHEGTHIQYLGFPISYWRSFCPNRKSSEVEKFTAPLWAFLDDALTSGQNVLVHCLAGAHRAGTTGCAVLIHYARMDAQTATASAMKLRSIIEPISDFPDFLRLLAQAEGIK